jgi:hypothetical protein
VRPNIAPLLSLPSARSMWISEPNAPSLKLTSSTVSPSRRGDVGRQRKAVADGVEFADRVRVALSPVAPECP